MPFTSDDLRQFTHFAEEQLRIGAADSISQLASRWERQRATDCGHAELLVAIFDSSRPLPEHLAESSEVVFGAGDLRQALSRTGGITTAELLAKAEAAAKAAGR
jgi:hypothetical protein